MFVITGKVALICLGLTCTAFTISTIVLAVQKADLEDNLREAQYKMDLLEEQLKNSTTTPTPPETTETPTTESPVDPPIDYRLPSYIKPTYYDLYLHPDIESGEFSGTITITVFIGKATNEIILHSNYLDIDLVSVDDFEGTNYYNSFKLVPEREFLIITTRETFKAESIIKVHIEFFGRMKNKIVGLYSSSYMKEDGKEKWIATSKFEPTYARQAFPCFDEPAMKAPFKIRVVHPGGDYSALSNMNQESEEPSGNNVIVHFNESVPMSTYLACFIVSDFQFKSAQVNTQGIGENFEMRVFATPQQLDKVDFSLQAGLGITEYYIQYFKIGYPLPKLDMAAIPDFVSGAMEHWGLVTFRETSLLYDEAVSSTANKQRIASVVAHEVAHMWFGNLVTMMWWNDLWLNEGFASYMEFKGVDAVYPKWKMHDQFIINTLHSVLSLDATLGSHPIVQTVENPDQITEIFDTITYSKGASIIRMLESFLGEEVFEESVTNYLNRYQYSNAVTANFLAEIDKLVTKINVTMIMRTWTEQMGLPVIQVKKISDSQYQLTQKRFFENPEDENGQYDDSPFNYKWSVPITYRTDEVDDDGVTWFDYDKSEVVLTVSSTSQWIKLNRNQVGYYRVNYPESQWQTLIEALISNPLTFSGADRAHLLNDAFALADATQLSFDIALDITKYLEKESEYVPWSVAASKLTSWKTSLMFTDTYQNYSIYSKKLIEGIYRDVTWTVGDDHLQNRLRVTVLSAACSLGLEECLNEASTRLAAWLQNPTIRPTPDLREVIYYYGMMHSGNEAIWEQMLNLFIDEQDASEKSKLMYGLSAIQSPWILNRFINLAWDTNIVRSQDYFTCIQYIAQNRVGEPLVWNFVRDNWENLVERFGLNERYLGSMIPSITGRFETQTKLEEMEQFFAKYPDAGAGTAARKRALENVKNNIKWLKENKDKVATWLVKYLTKA